MHVPFGVLAYNLPPRLRNIPGEVESAGREYRRRMEAAGVPADEMLRPEQYNFVLGLAFESPTMDAFRVFADQLLNGRGTATLQPAYNILLGRSFDKLDCHSNGAMVCLAALSRTDERRLRANEVRLLGPQITRDALEDWKNF